MAPWKIGYFHFPHFRQTYATGFSSGYPFMSGALQH
jgi:hypothetical protein